MDDKISFHDQVSVAEGIGTVQFIGKLPDFDDYFFGIELTTPTGGSNGSFDGKECFDCAAGHGVFVQRSEINELLSLGDTGICVGDAVSNEVYDCHGFVQYIGKIPPLPGVWFGIELIEPVGQHDGTFMGNRYFTCEENHGVCLSQDQIRFLSTVPPKFLIAGSSNADEEPEPEPQPEAQPDPEPQQDPEPEPVAQPEPEPVVEPEPPAEPQPATEPQPEESKEPEPIISPDLTPVNSGMGDEKAVDDQDKICFGDVVNLKKGRGNVKYIGPVDGKQGTFIGIELLKPAGKSNGSVNGRSYFKARPNHGIFTKRQRILTIVERKPEDFALRISVGDLVHVLSKDAHGVVKFIGVTPFGKPPRDQPYYGIEMEEPVGKNDGTVKGIRYFQTTENRGVFVRKDQLQLVQDDDSIGSF